MLEQTRETTLGVVNPQVGGSSVKDNLEALRWGSNGDLSVVLSVLVVIHSDIGGSTKIRTTEILLVKNDGGCGPVFMRVDVSGEDRSSDFATERFRWEARVLATIGIALQTCRVKTMNWIRPVS